MLTEKSFERFAHSIMYDGDCWLWRCRNSRAYRRSYELFIGPILRGRVIHHKCQQPRCVNPRHLEMLWPSEHCQRHAWLNGEVFIQLEREYVSQKKEKAYWDKWYSRIEALEERAIEEGRIFVPLKPWK